MSLIYTLQCLLSELKFTFITYTAANKARSIVVTMATLRYRTLCVLQTPTLRLRLLLQKVCVTSFTHA